MLNQIITRTGRRRSAIAILIGVACTASLFAQQQDSSPSFDSSKMSGEWKFISGMRAGAPALDENMEGDVSITEKDFTLSADGNTFVIAYQLNTKTDPVEIDMKITDGPAPPESKSIGIIKCADGKMTLCYDPTGRRRPKTFESTEDNGFHLFELARRPFDSERLVGKWKYESGQRAGQDIEAARLQSIVTITKDKFVVPAGPDAEFVMSYELVEGQTPVGIDLAIESGPAPDGKALGIIKLQDGKLFLCYDPTNAKRPEAFATTEEDGRFMFVLAKQPE